MLKSGGIRALSKSAGVVVVGAFLAVLPAHAATVNPAKAQVGSVLVQITGLPKGEKANVSLGCEQHTSIKSITITRSTTLRRLPASRCVAQVLPVQGKYRMYASRSAQSLMVFANQSSLLAVEYVPVKAGSRLHGVSLFDSSIDGYDLRRTDLSGITFTYGGFRNSNLSKASLAGAKCSECFIRASNLRGADLSNAWLMADIVDTDLTRANLGGATFEGAETGFSGMVERSTFAGADLRNAYLNASFTKTSFSGADLSGIRTGYASFRDVDFTGSNFAGADFRGVWFQNITSSGIVGKPAALPTGWQLVDGTLIKTG